MAIARCELPSGNWVEYREDLKAADKFAVQDAVILEYDENDKRRMRAGTINVMRNTLLVRTITAWSFEGIPVPGQNMAGVDTLGDILTIEDYDALAEAVAPLLDKITGVTAPNQQKSGN